MVAPLTSGNTHIILQINCYHHISSSCFVLSLTRMPGSKATIQQLRRRFGKNPYLFCDAYNHFDVFSAGNHILSTKRVYEQLAEQAHKEPHRRPIVKGKGDHFRRYTRREGLGEGVNSFFNFKQILEKFNSLDINRTAILSHSKQFV